MEHEHASVTRAEVLGERFGEIHRAMPPARAADADGDVRAVFRFETRQPRIEELLHVAQTSSKTA